MLYSISDNPFIDINPHSNRDRLRYTIHEGFLDFKVKYSPFLDRVDGALIQTPTQEHLQEHSQKQLQEKSRKARPQSCHIPNRTNSYPTAKRPLSLILLWDSSSMSSLPGSSDNDDVAIDDPSSVDPDPAYATNRAMSNITSYWLSTRGELSEPEKKISVEMAKITHILNECSSTTNEALSDALDSVDKSVREVLLHALRHCVDESRDDLICALRAKFNKIINLLIIPNLAIMGQSVLDNKFATSIQAICHLAVVIFSLTTSSSDFGVAAHGPEDDLHIVDRKTTLKLVDAAHKVKLAIELKREEFSGNVQGKGGPLAHLLVLMLESSYINVLNLIKTVIGGCFPSASLFRFLTIEFWSHRSTSQSVDLLKIFLKNLESIDIVFANQKFEILPAFEDFLHKLAENPPPWGNPTNSIEYLELFIESYNKIYQKQSTLTLQVNSSDPYDTVIIKSSRENLKRDCGNFRNYLESGQPHSVLRLGRLRSPSVGSRTANIEGIPEVESAFSRKPLFDFGNTFGSEEDLHPGWQPNFSPASGSHPDFKLIRTEDEPLIYQSFPKNNESYDSGSNDIGLGDVKTSNDDLSIISSQISNIPGQDIVNSLDIYRILQLKNEQQEDQVSDEKDKGSILLRPTSSQLFSYNEDRKVDDSESNEKDKRSVILRPTSSQLFSYSENRKVDNSESNEKDTRSIILRPTSSQLFSYNEDRKVDDSESNEKRSIILRPTSSQLFSYSEERKVDGLGSDEKDACSIILRPTSSQLFSYNEDRKVDDSKSNEKDARSIILRPTSSQLFSYNEDRKVDDSESNEKRSILLRPTSSQLFLYNEDWEADRDSASNNSFEFSSLNKENEQIVVYKRSDKEVMGKHDGYASGKQNIAYSVLNDGRKQLQIKHLGSSDFESFSSLSDISKILSPVKDLNIIPSLPVGPDPLIAFEHEKPKQTEQSERLEASSDTPDEDFYSLTEMLKEHPESLLQANKVEPNHIASVSSSGQKEETVFKDNDAGSMSTPKLERSVSVDQTVRNSAPRNPHFRRSMFELFVLKPADVVDITRKRAEFNIKLKTSGTKFKKTFSPSLVVKKAKERWRKH